MHALSELRQIDKRDEGIGILIRAIEEAIRRREGEAGAVGAYQIDEAFDALDGGGDRSAAWLIHGGIDADRRPAGIDRRCPVIRIRRHRHAAGCGAGAVDQQLDGGKVAPLPGGILAAHGDGVDAFRQRGEHGGRQGGCDRRDGRCHVQPHRSACARGGRGAQVGVDEVLSGSDGAVAASHVAGGAAQCHIAVALAGVRRKRQRRSGRACIVNGQVDQVIGAPVAGGILAAHIDGVIARAQRLQRRRRDCACHSLRWCVEGAIAGAHGDWRPRCAFEHVFGGDDVAAASGAVIDRGADDHVAAAWRERQRAGGRAGRVGWAGAAHRNCQEGEHAAVAIGAAVVEQQAAGVHGVASASRRRRRDVHQRVQGGAGRHSLRHHAVAVRAQVAVAGDHQLVEAKHAHRMVQGAGVDIAQQHAVARRHADRGRVREGGAVDQLIFRREVAHVEGRRRRAGVERRVDFT